MTASLHAYDVVAMPGQSPLIQFRIVFQAGSANDPAGKEGTATLMSAMLTKGGSKGMEYKQIVDAFYPMATGVRAQVDQEMAVFSASTHVDNLNAFYAIFRDMLLDPGWREDDLRRLRDNQKNFLRLNLATNNDEELGKEVLYKLIYAGHPYGHHPAGTLSGLDAISMDDLKTFYRQHLNRANLTIGVAGNYPKEFLAQMRKDFEKLPEGKPSRVKLPPVKPIARTEVTLVQKKTRAVAISLGYAIDVTRGDPDYAALLLVNAYFGPHRNSGGRLYQRMREIRGLNYGDYAYIEYFPRGMFQFERDPNLARRSQIFQMWIRPVEPPTAHFALRLALFELDRLIDNGLTEAEFEETRSYLMLNLNLLMKTKSAELGYAIDSKFYGIPEYTAYVKAALAKLTNADVHKAITKHLHKDRLEIVAVAGDAAGLRSELLSDAPSPMHYNSAKPEAILEEDKTVSTMKLGLTPAQIHIVPVEKVFE